MPRQIDWIQLFFSSAGRLPRTPFLIASAVLFALLAVYDGAANAVLHWITGWVVYPVLIFSAACVLSKRLHDRGRSGWWSALVLLAVAAIWPTPHGFFAFLFCLIAAWAVIDLAAMPGEQGINRFGPNPLRVGAPGAAA
jgi:uncharacterized membrane protein YhaH (DUF805 family)